VLVALGFPIALVIAWAFEVTPEGIKRTDDVDLAKKHSHGGAWIYIAIVGVALSVALFFLGRYSTRDRIGSGSRQKSIAVLPFESFPAFLIQLLHASRRGIATAGMNAPNFVTPV